jgi:hypothetical protein
MKAIARPKKLVSISAPNRVGGEERKMLPYAAAFLLSTEVVRHPGMSAVLVAEET